MNTELLLSTIDAAGIVATPTSGDELVMDCPLCDSTQKLYLNVTNGMWVCFKGQENGEKGGLQKFLLDVCELEPFEAYSLSVRIKGRSSKTPSSAAQALLTLPQQSSQAPRSVTLPYEFVLGHAAARRELERRGLDPDLCEAYGIGYCPTGYFEGRVIIPVYTENRLLTYVARTVIGDDVKVLMPKGSDAKHALFNHASVAPPLCVLVEGPFDALAMPDLAIATLGAHLSEYQRRGLKRLGYTHVVLMRDPDSTGIDAAVKEALELKAAMFKEVHVAMLPRGGKDPGEAPIEDLEKALAEMKLVEVDYGRAVLKEVVAL